MIETIFYFASNKSEFESNSGNISERTITFVPTSSTEGEIWKDGHKYSGISTDEVVEKITTLFQQGELPFATADKAGLVRLGKGLKARGTEGIVDVDFTNVQPTDISGLEELIRTILSGLIDPQNPETPTTADLTKLKLRISSNILQISYDNGSTWTNVGTVNGNNGDGSTVTVTPNSAYNASNGNLIGTIQIDNNPAVNLYAPKSTDGGGHTKTTVTVNQLLNSGVPVASISVDGGSAITIYAPAGGEDTGGEGGPTYIENPYDDTQLLNKITNVENDLANKWASLDNKIANDVEDLLDDAAWWQNNIPENVKKAITNFGQEDVEQYLQTLGMWTTVDGQTVTRWSKIEQDVDHLSTQVAAVIAGVGEEDLTALEASLQQYVDTKTATAINELSTVYARKDAEKILQWMYSGLTQGSNTTQTWNELVSAANSGGSGAIANVSTNIKKLAEGDYLATANLVTAITLNKDDITSVLASAGVLTSADLNNASSTLYSKLGEKYAAVDTAVTKSNGAIESNVTIKADQINLAGETNFTTAVGNALLAKQAFIDSLFANRALIGEYQSRNDGIYCKINPGSSYSDLKFESSSQEYVDMSANNLNGGWLKLYKNDTFGAALTTDMLEIGGDVDHTSGGDVAIRLLAASGSSSLSLKSTNTTSNDYITIDSGSGIVYRKIISGTTYTGNIGAGIWSLSDGVNTYSIMASGVSTTSDMRLKLVVDDVNLTASLIAEAPIFNYKTSTTSDQTFVGTSAQYWETVLPNTVKEINGYLSLDYTKVNTASVINLAKEVVTLNQEKAALVERIEALEARLQLIENQLNAQ